MKQVIFTLVVIIASFGLIAVVVLGSRAKKNNINPVELPDNQNNGVNNRVPVFYYGNTCPHCSDVEEWMEENKIEEKIKIIKKEVYDNQANSLELVEVAKKCGLSTNGIGVPFLYTPEGKCLIGTPDIIAYLGDKAGLSGSQLNNLEKEREQ